MVEGFGRRCALCPKTNTYWKLPLYKRSGAPKVKVFPRMLDKKNRKAELESDMLVTLWQLPADVIDA